ncbi:hypothetical protein AZI86_11705 [Bdellovibrio bacteriovorus]|uniref:Uncharacterized protein n=1 Tax=Bdellovibrio bacteriovorus TaxID=959 RepID=A0A150WLH5_BDEBC|nr:hypothetical protein [Bdellovibrio bacteriovorus]KYG64861.1 hypothetical protein AZI86_11705 [Bdellovibrio bacteriovorus]
MQKKVLLVSAILGSAILFYKIQNFEEKTTKETSASEILAPESVPLIPALEVKAEDLVPEKAPERRPATTVDQQEFSGLDKYYCLLKEKNLDIPLQGEMRLRAFSMTNIKNEVEAHRIQIHSEGCGKGTFSEVFVDNNMKVLGMRDCRNFSREVEAIFSGIIYGAEIESPSKQGILNVASQNGLFVRRCEEETQFSLDGGFITREGILRDAAGCEILDRRGESIEVGMNSTPDQNGCFENGQCLALIHPSPESAWVINKDTFLGVNDFSDLLVPVREVMVQEGFLGRAHPEMGLTDTDTTSWPVYNPAASCASL